MPVTEMAKPCNKQKMNRKWYAIYTRPRWEKKADRLLQERGISSYCPLHKTKRQWSDRIKLVELPLFTSYVFVHISESEMQFVRSSPGVLNFVYWNGKPAIIKEKEISDIKRFLDNYEEVEAVQTDVKPGDKISVAAGPLMDQKGRVLDVKKKIVKIRIESLGYNLVAYVDKKKLVKGI